MGALRPWHVAVLGCLCLVAVAVVVVIAVIAARAGRKR